jgi:GT2 family glycosyltransferase
MQKLIEAMKEKGNLGYVYCVVYDEEMDEPEIWREAVVGIGPKGVYISEFDPPKPDSGWMIEYERFGEDFFFAREEAEAMLAKLKSS